MSDWRQIFALWPRYCTDSSRYVWFAHVWRGLYLHHFGADYIYREHI